VQTRKYYRGSDFGSFFYSELASQAKTYHLLKEAYILVHHIHFTYADVKQMSRKDRDIFINFFVEDGKREKEIRDTSRNQPK